MTLLVVAARRSRATPARNTPSRPTEEYGEPPGADPHAKDGNGTGARPQDGPHNPPRRPASPTPDLGLMVLV